MARPKSGMTRRIQILITDEQAAALERHRRANGRNVGEHVRAALDLYSQTVGPTLAPRDDADPAVFDSQVAEIPKE